MDEWKDVDLSFIFTKYDLNKFYTKMFSNLENIYPLMDHLKHAGHYKVYPYTHLELYYLVNAHRSIHS